MTALHGFLGLPSDWDGLLPDTAWKPAWLDALAAVPGGAEEPALPQLAAALNASARDEPGAVLIGYSMGGRIAMHMLLDDVETGLWSRAVIISASPGLSDPDEKRRRAENDARWACRLRTEAWGSVIGDWNRQPVFAHDGGYAWARDEADFDRESLGRALTKGSVGAQADLRPALSSLKVPVLFMAGECDSKYCDLAMECAGLNTLFEWAILPGGHRAPWADPKRFRAELDRFLGTTDPS